MSMVSFYLTFLVEIVLIVNFEMQVAMIHSIMEHSVWSANISGMLKRKVFT